MLWHCCSNVSDLVQVFEHELKIEQVKAELKLKLVANENKRRKINMSLFEYVTLHTLAMCTCFMRETVQRTVF